MLLKKILFIFSFISCMLFNVKMVAQESNYDLIKKELTNEQKKLLQKEQELLKSNRIMISNEDNVEDKENYSGGYVLDPEPGLYKNIGVFDDVEIFFDKDVNIIFGRNATGKTTIIRSLAKAFGFFGSTLGHFLKHGKDRGKIKIRVSKERNLVIQYKLSGGDVEVREHIKSMLLDEPADLLDQRNKREFIEWVKERFNCQIIIATHDKNMVDIGDKVISQN